MKTKRSKVMTIANKMVANGESRSSAMIKSWALVKVPHITSKVSGVTFGRRQEILGYLSGCTVASVNIELVREKDNRYDRNAISIVATVNGRAFKMGYLPAALSFILAPVIDIGKIVTATFNTVTGGFYDGMCYGMSIKLTI